MKRILTIQDISCVGKCSLTVALPIISAFGVECSVLPTAILSNHTAFPEFSFLDLTNELTTVADKFKNQNITFDALYSGYIGSIKQLNIVKQIFEKFKTCKNFILVDPAMADNGKLYHGFDNNFIKEMVELCKKAEIIVPNMTEASFLLNIPYVESGYNKDYIENVLVKLSDYGPKIVILTGISFDNSKIGIYGYNKINKKYFYYFNKKYDKNFHGTGDIFASALCGGINHGFSIEKASEIAVDFTAKSIYNTIQDKNSRWYGVNFESAIPYLINKISK